MADLEQTAAQPLSRLRGGYLVALLALALGLTALPLLTGATAEVFGSAARNVVGCLGLAMISARLFGSGLARLLPLGMFGPTLLLGVAADVTPGAVGLVAASLVQYVGRRGGPGRRSGRSSGRRDGTGREGSLRETGPMEWRSAGLSWVDSGRPALVWERGDVSPLVVGRRVGFRALGRRECVGARGNPCPVAAAVPARGPQARCAECARLDRAHSVAADTIADDPRTYRVYLAWFGVGMVKVGITREERGPARLLEQGAVAFAWLGRGPLMAARRTEELLRVALGVPDRISYARKRAVRASLPGAEERRRELERMHAFALALEGWPESLERVPPAVVDHGETFGLERLAGVTAFAVTELVDGGVVRGDLVAVAGPDVCLDDAGRLIVLDSRLLRGWRLEAAREAARTTVPVREVPVVQGGLF